jgi:hypothetical protein
VASIGSHFSWRAFPLIQGSAFAYIAIISANDEYNKQVVLMCARDAIYRKFYADLPLDEFHRKVATKLEAVEAGRDTLVREQDLKELGCSHGQRTVSVHEIFSAPPPSEFGWMRELLSGVAKGLGLMLAVSIAVYGVVRAMGWVIGGFFAATP